MSSLRPHFSDLAAGLTRYGVSTSASSTSSNGGDSNRRGEEEEFKNVKALSSWIDLYLPRRIRPYAHLARLDKPIGTWLLAWPCMWYSFVLSIFVRQFVIVTLHYCVIFLMFTYMIYLCIL